MRGTKKAPAIPEWCTFAVQHNGGLMKAPILLAFLGLATVQAAEPTTLTLACEGTVADNIKPDAKPATRSCE